jgi:hypothetical protein
MVNAKIKYALYVYAGSLEITISDVLCTGWDCFGVELVKPIGEMAIYRTVVAVPTDDERAAQLYFKS